MKTVKLHFKKPTKHQYILATLLTSIVLVYTFVFWLSTCGFKGCPTEADIQAFQPDEGGRVLDRNGYVMGPLAVVRRINVPLSDVPQHVRDAFLATEDRRFYQHAGIDWRGVVRATFRNVRNLGVREGFSTITMQVVRNTFAVRRYQGRSLRQKLLEMRLSRLLERHLSKDQILELYLNVLYLGNGMYGVEAASRDLFGKSVKNLTVSEGAMLAALPKGPSAYTPRRSAKRALARRNLVLSLMVREGYLDANTGAEYEKDPLVVAKEEWRPDQGFDSYAMDAVRQMVDSVLKSGSLDVNDLTVHTTLDTKAQVAAIAAVQRQAAVIQRESNGAGKQLEGAMVALDPRTGDVRALVGGRKYERGNFNRAFFAHRQPGSAFKPFIYEAALVAGATPATEVVDEPVAIPIGRTVWRPKNHGGEYGGDITYRRALMRSSNAAAVKVSQLVGMPAVLEAARKNGIRSELADVPAAALGAMEVTPLELVTAYAPFSNGGYAVTPRLVRRIEASNGNVLWSQDNRRVAVMDSAVAYQMTSMLRAVVDYGTGYIVRQYGVKGLVAGKTGTTNDGADVWFVGYTPTIVAGFWFGYDEPRPVSYDASGGRLAAPAWIEFYRTGWVEPVDSNAWKPPAGLVVATIDARTGFLANEWCPITKQEYFKPGTVPTHLCPYHSEPLPTDTLNIFEQVPNAIERGVKGIGNLFKKVFKGGRGDSTKQSVPDSAVKPI